MALDDAGSPPTRWISVARAADIIGRRFHSDWCETDPALLEYDEATAPDMEAWHRANHVEQVLIGFVMGGHVTAYALTDDGTATTDLPIHWVTAPAFTICLRTGACRLDFDRWEPVWIDEPELMAILPKKGQPRKKHTYEWDKIVHEAWMFSLRQGRIPVLPIHGIVDGDCTCGDEECESPGKHPISSLVRNGVKGATVDAQVIQRWHRRHPDMNYAVATEGLAVIDCDSREALRAFRSGYHPPPTFTVKTARGFHFYYRGEMPARNGAQINLDVKSGPGCYVVGPSSMHVSGAIYALWENKRIANLPQNIADITERRDDPTDAGGGGPIPVGLPRSLLNECSSAWMLCHTSCSSVPGSSVGITAYKRSDAAFSTSALHCLRAFLAI